MIVIADHFISLLFNIAYNIKNIIHSILKTKCDDLDDSFLMKAYDYSK